jgi:predicted ATPase/DNA-binding CsgD family transcriptional regulator
VRKSQHARAIDPPDPPEGRGGPLVGLPTSAAHRQVRSPSLLPRSLRPSALIGRQAELAAVRELLADPSVQVVSLTGRSGVGKTRLALEVAWVLDADRPGSVRLVSLAGLCEPELVYSEIAAQLAVATLPGRPLGAVLIRWLDQFPLVLVLDNFEHLLPGAHLLNDLLDGCPDLKLLVTSQAPLHLRTERVVRLSPLPLPAENWGQQADVADQPAVALYFERARAADHQFRLGADNAAAVVALCRQLEGLPLAIELAAARATTVPAAEMLTRVSDHRLDALRSSLVDAPARHQDMRAAIGWTYQLLSPIQQDLLTRLSVVVGPFEVEDAEALGGMATVDVLDGLDSLVDLHLVEAVSDGDIARFELPLSIREFARNELIASGQLDPSQEVWTGWLAGRARSAAHGLHEIHPDGCWDWLARSHDRLLNALRCCLEEERVDEALDLLAGLAPIWANRALEPAHRRLFEQTIEMAETHGRENGALAEALISSALLGIRVLAADRRDVFVERLSRGEELARQLGDDERVLRALDCWTRVAPMTGERARALAAISEGLELASRLGSSCWLARFEVQKGRSLAAEGKDEAALAMSLGAEAHAREASDTVAMLQAAQVLHAMAPKYPQAVAALPPPEELLAMARSKHQTVLEAVLLPTLAVQAVAGGDLTMAAHWCRRGLELSGFDSSSYLAGFAVVAGVEIAAASGDHKVAARFTGRLLDAEYLLYAAMPPPLVANHKRVIAEIRKALGAKDFATRTAEGSALAWEAAFRELDAYLRGIEIPDPTPPASLSEARAPARPDVLTNRQLEVVGLLSRGMANKEIARVLGVTPKTVMHHTVAIYQKLGVRGRSEAVAWATRTGLVPQSG